MRFLTKLGGPGSPEQGSLRSWLRRGYRAWLAARGRPVAINRSSRLLTAVPSRCQGSVRKSRWETRTYRVLTSSGSPRFSRSEAPSQCHRTPDRGLDLAAIPRGTTRRPSVSIRDSRPGQHLLPRTGQRGCGHGRASVANTGPVAESEFRMRTLRRDIAPRMSDFLIPFSERHLKFVVKSWITHFNHGRPHMSIGPAIPAPLRQSPPESPHRHQIPSGYKVRSTAILGGLHHEYWLEPLMSSLPFRSAFSPTAKCVGSTNTCSQYPIRPRLNEDWISHCVHLHLRDTIQNRWVFRAAPGTPNQ